VEGTPNQKIGVPGRIVDYCGQVPPLDSGLALPVSQPLRPPPRSTGRWLVSITGLPRWSFGLISGLAFIVNIEILLFVTIIDSNPMDRRLVLSPVIPLIGRFGPVIGEVRPLFGCVE
jgi:hypothetical protein